MCNMFPRLLLHSFTDGLAAAVMQGITDTGSLPAICLTNSQTIRRTLTEGAVSLADLERMLPPEEGTELTVLEIPTTELKTLLENSVSALNSSFCTLPHDAIL